jgi:hypothetical protein
MQVRDSTRVELDSSALRVVALARFAPPTYHMYLRRSQYYYLHTLALQFLLIRAAYYTISTKCSHYQTKFMSQILTMTGTKLFIFYLSCPILRKS